MHESPPPPPPSGDDLLTSVTGTVHQKVHLIPRQLGIRRGLVAHRQVVADNEVPLTVHMVVHQITLPQDLALKTCIYT